MLFAHFVAAQAGFGIFILLRTTVIADMARVFELLFLFSLA